MLPNARLALLLLLAAAVAISRPATGQPPNRLSAVTVSAETRQASPLSELRQPGADALQTAPLAQAESPTLQLALDELAETHGLVPISPEAFILGSQKAPGGIEAWVIELEQAEAPSNRLFLYYLPNDDSLYFLRIETHGDSAESVRLWGSGRSELVMSRDGVAVLDAPSDSTFRLRRSLISTDKSAADTIACLGRQLGLTPSSTNLGNVISQATCGATNVLSLALTTYNCLSIPHPIATVGCIVGVSKLVTCGFANCSSPTGTATVEWTVADGCADNRGFKVRIFDRTRGGFYPSGSFYSIPAGGTQLLRFSAPRGSQLCIGAQTNPPTSDAWCVGFSGSQNPNYPGAGTAICCATVPNSGKLVKANRLTCG